jgi:hypothetical protein
LRHLVSGLVVAGLLCIPTALAHRSGCHAWHSCPSDRGTYECGDTGHCNQCPDNAYCSDGKPRQNAEPAKSKRPSQNPQQAPSQ